MRRLYRGGADRLGVRAKGKPARRGAAGLCKSPGRARGGGRPDRQGPPVGESGREGGEADWTGRGEWADGDPWAAGGRKKKEKREMEGWAGNQESEREKLSIFFQKKNKHIQI